MATQNAPLGSCSFCGATVSRQDTIIEYERDDGSTGIWAECPACREVVDPE